VNNLTIVQPVTHINNSSLKVTKISPTQVTQQQTFAQQQQNLSVVRKQTDAAFVAKGPTPKVGETGPPRALKLAPPGVVAKNGAVQGPPIQSGNPNGGGAAHVDKKVVQDVKVAPPINKAPVVNTPADKHVIHDVKPPAPVVTKPVQDIKVAPPVNKTPVVNTPVDKHVPHDVKLPAPVVTKPVQDIKVAPPINKTPAVNMPLDKKVIHDAKPPAPVVTKPVISTPPPKVVHPPAPAVTRAASLPKTGNAMSTPRPVHVNPVATSRPPAAAHTANSRGHKK
jgi:hypothetical protein